MPSKAQIWERSRPDPATPQCCRRDRAIASRDLARNPLDSEEGAEDCLFPVKVESVGAGKGGRDLLAQLGPASGRRPLRGGATPDPIPGGVGARSAASRADGDLAEHMRQEFLDGAIGVIGFAARQPVGQRMQRGGIKALLARQQCQDRSIQLDPAGFREFERSPDAAIRQGDQSGGMRRRQVGPVGFSSRDTIEGGSGVIGNRRQRESIVGNSRPGLCATSSSSA